MKRLVIFDCDGVLVDSERISATAMCEQILTLGLQTTPSECHREYAGTWWPDTLARIEQRLGRPLPASFTDDFRKRQMAALSRGVDPVDGVVDALERIDATSCVASNGPHEKMAVTLAAAGLLARFEGKIFSSYDEGVERGKPYPDLFLHAAGAMGFEPADCIVVEDSVFGVEAGVRAGMLVLGYDADADSAALAAAGAHCFSAMSELPELLASA